MLNQIKRFTFIVILLFVSFGTIASSFILALGILESKEDVLSANVPAYNPITQVQKISINKPSENIRLSFVGDMMFDRYIRKIGERNGYGYTFKNISLALTGNDVIIGNLEGPVTTFASLSTDTNWMETNHFLFTFSAEILPILYNSNIRIVTIGNNHILNFGTDGLDQTKTFLQLKDINYFGDPYDEQNIFILDKRGVKIAFIAYNQFLLPAKDSTVQKIRELSSQADFVVVYAHWGEEYEEHPNDTQVALAHAFIDAGADLVVGAHPHVVQDKEIYKGKSIYYSLGNFIFDQYFSDSVQCGALIRVTIYTDNYEYSVEEDFIHLEKDGTTLLSNCLYEIPHL